MQAPFEAAQEPIQFPAAPVIRDELPYRLRQQSLLGEFGRIAMQTRDFRRILQRATELCAQGLQARFAKVLEYEPDQKRLLVRAGVGWAPDTIDIVSVAADLGSPAGYAYQTGESVISNHLEAETRLTAICRRAGCSWQNRTAPTRFPAPYGISRPRPRTAPWTTPPSRQSSCCEKNSQTS